MASPTLDCFVTARPKPISFGFTPRMGLASYLYSLSSSALLSLPWSYYGTTLFAWALPALFAFCLRCCSIPSTNMATPKMKARMTPTTVPGSRSEISAAPCLPKPFRVGVYLSIDEYSLTLLCTCVSGCARYPGVIPLVASSLFAYNSLSISITSLILSASPRASSSPTLLDGLLAKPL